MTGRCESSSSAAICIATLACSTDIAAVTFAAKFYAGSDARRRDEDRRRPPNDPVADVRGHRARRAHEPAISRPASHGVPRPQPERGATPTTSVRAGAKSVADLESRTRQVTASVRPSRRSSMMKGYRPGSGPITSATLASPMTQDKCMARGRVHTAVAELLDRTINDE